MSFQEFYEIVEIFILKMTIPGALKGNGRKGRKNGKNK